MSLQRNRSKNAAGDESPESRTRVQSRFEMRTTPSLEEDVIRGEVAEESKSWADNFKQRGPDDGPRDGGHSAIQTKASPL